MVGDPCGGRAGRGQRSRWAGGWAGTQQAAAAPPRVSVAMRCREVQQATGSSAAGVWGVASTQRVGPLAGPQAGTPRVLHAEHVRPAGPCQLPLLRGAGRHAAGLVRRRHLLMVRRAPPPETGPTHPPTHPPTQCSRTPPPPHTHTHPSPPHRRWSYAARKLGTVTTAASTLRAGRGILKGVGGSFQACTTAAQRL